MKEHIPGIEYLKVSYIKAGYEAYDKYGELGAEDLSKWLSGATTLKPVF
ncbi:hypothetical protein O9929_20925 [Vibrio lentus]|nr:hypothetical protein [Vibrio lentus]